MSKLANKRSWVEVLVWGAVTLFLIAFPFIYYQFSHGMRSAYMSYAFLVPLAVLLFALLIALLKKDIGGFGRLFLNTGAASISIYLLLRGVYEMASNYNEGTPAFLYIGIASSLVGVALSLIHLFHRPPEAAQE
jgi:peptidoglycan/LPS O-acetylase OafA/YrhL